MMYINYPNSIRVSAHVGHPNNRYPLITEGIISVQCDGDELVQAQQILGRTSNLRVHTFFGEAAREIVANWR